MNNHRRKEIARALGLLNEAAEIIDFCQNEEQDYFDNMPEAFQAGEKGQKAEEVAGCLEENLDSIQTIVAELEEAAQ